MTTAGNSDNYRLAHEFHNRVETTFGTGLLGFSQPANLDDIRGIPNELLTISNVSFNFAHSAYKRTVPIDDTNSHHLAVR